MKKLLHYLLFGISLLALSCAASHAMEPEDIYRSYLQQVAPLEVEQPINYLQLLPAELREYLIQFMTRSKTPYELGQNMRGMMMNTEFAQFLPIFIGLQKAGVNKWEFIAGLDMPEAQEFLIHDISQSKPTKNMTEIWGFTILNRWATKGRSSLLPGEIRLFAVIFGPDYKEGKYIPAPINFNKLLDNTIENEPIGNILLSRAIEHGNIDFIRFILTNRNLILTNTISLAFKNLNDASYDIITLLLQHEATFDNTQLLDDVRFLLLLSSTVPVSLTILKLLLDESTKNKNIRINLEQLVFESGIALTTGIDRLNAGDQAFLKQKKELIRQYVQAMRND